MTHHLSRAAEIREKLGHPVIDADGHTVELMSALADYLTEVGGLEMTMKALTFWNELPRWDSFSERERLDQWFPRPLWWPYPTANARDRATAHLPALFRSRLDEFGIDFSVVYSTFGLVATGIEDEELRRALCRAINRCNADSHRDHRDRMTPAAVIPMHTPAEALEEIDYCVNELGSKVAMFAGFARRRIHALERLDPSAAKRFPRLDLFAIDSEFDYDPVWRRCEDLSLPVTFHQVGFHGENFVHGHPGLGATSISNFAFNRLNNFGASNHAICKAMMFGGVTRRFPGLRLGFLEGGAAWACSLFGDLVETWATRRPEALRGCDPAALDTKALTDLFEKYGGRYAGAVGEVVAQKNEPRPEVIDEFAAMGIRQEKDFLDLFVNPVHVGCEPDDRTVRWAFDERVNPVGAQLKVMFSSDIGHFDIEDAARVLEEAYELVEDGLIDESQFRRFTFGNAVSLLAGGESRFFDGTSLESEVGSS